MTHNEHERISARLAQQESWHPRGSETKNTTDEIAYNTIALCNESGEFADVVKKSMRGDYSITDERTRRAAALELGDVLWYLARLADELGFPLEQVAAMNLAKISRRKIMREENEEAFTERFQEGE